MGKGGAVLGLIGIILGASGIVFGYINWTSQSNNSTQTKVVGVWDGLATNRDYSGYDQLHTWFFEFTDNEMNNSVYISVSNTNTRITLLQPGWYRIHFSVNLNSLAIGGFYYIRLLKDHTIVGYVYVLDQRSAANVEHKIDSFAFVYSDGTNYIEIGAHSTSLDTFGISGTFNNFANRLSIEFVSA